ncbi:adenosylcobinamide-GDP ribazoletransferase, partial [Streptomyces nogalater]
AAAAVTAAARAAGACLGGYDGARTALAVAAGLAVAEVLLRRCVRRFGGVTGDVFGALAETAATTALVLLSLGR